jgi:hypothetical protein
VTFASNYSSPAVRPGRSPLATALIALIGSVSLFVVAIVGISFLALAVAFPVVVQLVQDRQIVIPASDLALAKDFAAAAWMFAVVGVATLVASVIAAVKFVQYLDDAPSE